MAKEKYRLIGKTIYFLESGVLAVGDLHLGYEEMLKREGVEFPLEQIKQTINDLEEVFSYLKKNKLPLKKMVFLGDLGHHFGFEKADKYGLLEVINVCRKYIGEENIIFIRGNHDKGNVGNGKLEDYVVIGNICFLHGDKDFIATWDKKIKTWVIGHLHPSITLSDKQNVKSEKYKCFLVGAYKGKEVVVVPSFFPLVVGRDITEDYSKGFIPEKELKKFKIWVVGEELEVFEFGRLKNLR